jgi:hypothetical protein
MATIKAELQRKDALNNLVAWMLVNDAANSSTGRSDPVIDFGARQTLASILAELQDTLTVDGTVDIDAGTVALLRDVQAAVTGEVALDAATIADLKTIVATVSGTVDVGNFPVLGVISDGNSTDTPLGSGASFVGTGIEVLDFVSCEVTVFANVASANQGLRLETSPDGTNWSHYHTYTVPANANRCYQFTLSARYFRVVYVNGGTAQTTFRLQTRLSRAAAAPHYHELDHPVDGTHPAQIVRAVLTGQQTGGQAQATTSTCGSTRRAGWLRKCRRRHWATLSARPRSRRGWRTRTAIWLCRCSTPPAVSWSPTSTTKP